MRSLAFLQALLVLLVLVPAGVLGWLGLKAADGYEATTRDAYQRELFATAELLRGVGPQVLAQEDEDTSHRLDVVSDQILERLPFEPSAVVLGDARLLLAHSGSRAFDAAWGGGQVRLGLIDAEGRGLLPRELATLSDVGGSDAPGTDRERLLVDLRREADAALFGRGDPAAAAAVWGGARERAREASLRAALDAEAAWTALRLAQDPAAFRQSVERLERAHGSEGMRAAGRTWVLLLLRAGEGARLAALAHDGWLDEVPLTPQERARIERLQGAPGRTFARLQTLERPLRQGVRLRVVKPDGSGAIVLDRLREVVRALEVPVVVREGRLPLTGMASGDAPDALLHPVEILRASGPPLAYVLEHGGLAGLRADVAQRRRLTSIAVGSLLAVMLLGLLLTRRAVLREREAVRLRDDFLANVSHELRTPLTSVSLHADLLARPDVPPEKRREHVEVVRAEGARLAALVEDLLDFAALERGARRLAPEPVALLPAVERALAPYRVLAEQAGSVLALDLAPPAPRDLEALADPQALARILANLLGNAFKHGTPARDGGPPTVRVCVGRRDGQVRLEVRDNGPGVPREERAHLFERFRRGRAAGARPGTGLGLALSRGLARAMGGDLVWAEEPPETVFRLTLPAFDAMLGQGMHGPEGEARA